MRPLTLTLLLLLPQLALHCQPAALLHSCCL
jgi:hypothetical protein